jgi:hypothetical protein
MDRKGVPWNMLATVRVNHDGDGELPQREWVTRPTLVTRGGLSGSRRCARIQRSYVREQLSGGASVTVNLISGLS